MMKRTVRWMVMAGLVVMAGSAFAEDEKDEKVLLSDVPKTALEAAQKAVPGIVLTDAEVEKSDEGLVYELEGDLNGTEYEIEVSADGKVLDVEHGDDDRDDDAVNDDSDDDSDSED